MRVDKIKSLAKQVRNELRDNTVGRLMRERLCVNSLSIVSNDCTGGWLYHDLHMRFDSPFINMFLSADDYVNVISDLDGYLSQDLCEETRVSGYDYPLARLGDALIHMVHYESFAFAKSKWEERVERFDFENTLFIMNDRNGFTRKAGKCFAVVAGEHGVLFTHKEFGITGTNVCVVDGCADCDCVPIMTAYKSNIAIHKNYDCFDFVRWINQSLT